MKTIILILAAVLLSACDPKQPTSNQAQAAAQERILQEGNSQVGLPAIKNFRERRLLKAIYELRDQDGLSTFAYVIAHQSGKPVFLCNSVGFAMSDATGFTNPDKWEQPHSGAQYQPFPQAEPNGLFTPDTSSANWVMCLDTKAGKPVPVFVQGDIIVSSMRLGE